MWTVQQPSFCDDAECTRVRLARGERLPPPDTHAAAVLSIAKLVDSDVDVSPLRRAVETGSTPSVAELVRYAAASSVAASNGSARSSLAPAASSPGPSTGTGSGTGDGSGSAVSSTSRALDAGSSTGDSVVVTALSSGRVVLCAQLATPAGSAGGPVACRRLRVVERLLLRPRGSLHAAPATRLRMRLSRQLPVSHAEVAIALPSSQFTWLTTNMRVANVAVHHGVVDAVAEGACKLLVLDMNLRDPASALVAAACHEAPSSGDSTAAAGGECSDDDVGGVSAPLRVVQPAYVTLWLEPAARVPLHRRILASLRGGFETAEEAAAAASCTSICGESELDNEYDEVDGIARVTPWVQAVQGPKYAPVDGMSSSAASLACAGYYAASCVPVSPQPLVVVAGGAYVLHAHAVGADGYRLVYGDNVRLSVAVSLPVASVDGASDASLAHGRSSVAVPVVLRAVGASAAPAEDAEPRAGDSAAGGDASGRAPADTSAAAQLGGIFDVRVANSSAGREALLEARLGAIEHPGTHAVWRPHGFEWIAAQAAVTVVAPLTISWPRARRYLSIQVVAAQHDLACASGNASVCDAGLLDAASMHAESVDVPHILVALDAEGGRTQRVPLALAGGPGAGDSSTTFAAEALPPLALDVAAGRPPNAAAANLADVCVGADGLPCSAGAGGGAIRVQSDGVIVAAGAGDAVVTATSNAGGDNSAVLLVSAAHPSALLLLLQGPAPAHPAGAGTDAIADSGSQLFNATVGDHVLLVVEAVDARGRTFDVCTELSASISWGVEGSAALLDDTQAARDAHVPPSHACAWAVATGRGPGSVRFTARYGGLTASAVLRVYEPFRVVYPPRLPDIDRIGIASQSSLAILLVGGPQSFPPAHAVSTARSDVAAAATVTQNVQLRVCAHAAVLAAESDAPSAASKPGADGGVCTRWMPLEGGRTASSTASAAGLNLAEGVLRVSFELAHAAETSREAVLAASQGASFVPVYAFRVSCSSGGAPPMRVVWYARHAGRGLAASAELIVQCAVPQSIVARAVRGEAWRWDGDNDPLALAAAWQPSPPLGASAFVVQTDEPVMLTAAFAGAGGLRLLNTTGALLPSFQLAAASPALAVLGQPYFSASADADAPARLAEVLRGMYTAPSPRQLLRVFAPNLTVVPPAAEQGSFDTPAHFFWRRRAHLGWRLGSAASLPTPALASLLVRSLRADTSRAAAAAEAPSALATTSVDVAIVSPSQLIPPSLLLFAQADNIQPLFCVGGTGAHEFQLPPPAAAVSQDGLPQAVATVRSLQLGLVHGAAMKPSTGTRSSAAVAPTMVGAGTVAAACVDTWLPGGQPSRGDVTVATAAALQLEAHRLVPLRAAQRLAVRVLSADGRVFPTAQHPHMRLRFNITAAGSENNVEEPVLRIETRQRTESCGTAATDAGPAASARTVIDGAAQTAPCGHIDYLLHAERLGTVRIVATVSNCPSHVRLDPAAHSGALDHDAAVHSDCRDVHSAPIIVTVYQPLEVQPQSLVLVPDAMLRLQVVGGPPEPGMGSGPGLRFSSSNPAVVRVSADGVVTAGADVGAASVTVQLVGPAPSGAIAVFGSVVVDVRVALPRPLRIVAAPAATGARGLPASVLVAGDSLQLSLGSEAGHSPLSFAGVLVNASATWLAAADAPELVPSPPWRSVYMRDGVVTWDAVAETPEATLTQPVSRLHDGFTVLARSLSTCGVASEPGAHCHGTIGLQLVLHTRRYGTLRVSAFHTVALVPRLHVVHPRPLPSLTLGDCGAAGLHRSAGGARLPAPMLLVAPGIVTRVRTSGQAVASQASGLFGALGATVSTTFALVSEGDTASGAPVASAALESVTADGVLTAASRCSDGSAFSTFHVTEALVLDNVTAPASRDGAFVSQYPVQRLAIVVECAPIAALEFDAGAHLANGETDVAEVVAGGTLTLRATPTDGRGRMHSVGLRSACLQLRSPATRSSSVAATPECDPERDLGLTVYSSDSRVARATVTFALPSEDAWVTVTGIAGGLVVLQLGHDDPAARAVRLLGAATAATVNVASPVAFATGSGSTGSLVRGGYVRVRVRSQLYHPGNITLVPGSVLRFFSPSERAAPAGALEASVATGRVAFREALRECEESVAALLAHAAAAAERRRSRSFLSRGDTADAPRASGWLSSNATAFAVDATTGCGLALASGDAVVSFKSSAAGGSGGAVARASHRVHVAAGDALVAQLAAVSVDELLATRAHVAPAGAHLAAPASSSALVVTDVEAVPGTISRVVEGAAASVPAAFVVSVHEPSPRTTAVQLGQTIPTGHGAPVQQALRFNCSLEAFDATGAAVAADPWLQVSAAGAGAARGSLAVPIPANDTAAAITERWMRAVAADASRPALQPGILAVAAEGERLCVLSAGPACAPAAGSQRFSGLLPFQVAPPTCSGTPPARIVVRTHVAALALSRRVRVVVRHNLLAAGDAGEQERVEDAEPSSSTASSGAGTASVDDTDYGFTLFPSVTTSASAPAAFVPRLRVVPVPAASAWLAAARAAAAGAQPRGAAATGGPAPASLLQMALNAVGLVSDGHPGEAVTEPSRRLEQDGGAFGSRSGIVAYTPRARRSATTAPSVREKALALNWTAPLEYDAASASIVLSRLAPHVAVFLYSAMHQATVEADSRLNATIRSLDASSTPSDVVKAAVAHSNVAQKPWGVLYVSLADSVLHDAAAPCFVDAFARVTYAPAGQLMSLLFAYDNGTGLHHDAAHAAAVAEQFTSTASTEPRRQPAMEVSGEVAKRTGAATSQISRTVAQTPREAGSRAVVDDQAGSEPASPTVHVRWPAVRFEYTLLAVGAVILVVVVALRNAVLVPVRGAPAGAAPAGPMLSPRQGAWRPGAPLRRLPGTAAPPGVAAVGHELGAAPQ